MEKRITEKVKGKTAGRPARQDKDNKTVPSAERYTLPGDKRKTYLVSIDLADKIDEIAHMDRTTVKAVVKNAFASHIGKWEKKNGPLIVPKRK